MGEWKECKLGDAITLQRGHDLPKSKMMNGLIPVAGSNGIIGYHNRATTHAPGITIGRSGNLGNPYFYKEEFWAHNTTLYVKDFKGNNELFIYYFLKTFDFKQFNVGSAVPTLNRNHIHPLDVIVPPLPEQKAIAAVLSSLDDKIDLLHRQNTTLEAMAETLFRQWFVEEAQEDWEEGCLGDVASFHNGKERPDDIIGGDIPIYGGNGILGYSDQFNYEGTTVIIGRVGAYCGSLYIERNPVWISDNALVGKPFNKKHSSFLFFLLEMLQLNDMAEGSSHPLLTQTLLKSLQIILPPERLIESFVFQADTWLNRIDKNNNQIQTLEKLRNTLLPKLMSGEVRVEYAP